MLSKDRGESQEESQRWTIDQTTGRLTTAYGLDLGGNSIQNVSAIMSASGNWRVDENGLLVVKEVRAKRGTFEEGVTIYDKVTREPRCAYFENGVWTSIIGECGGSAAPRSSPSASEPDTASSTTP